MITSFLLALREGLEAALVIGIVLGALRRTSRPGLSRWLWAGVFSAALVSLVAALLLRIVDTELEGVTEQIFEGITFLLAASVLTWMIFWMRRESSSMRTRLEKDVTFAAIVKGRGALYFLAFISVLREGIELALYITASSLTLSGIQTILGTAVGLAAACCLGYLIYSATIKLNLRRFFQVTSLILILFAAGLISHGVAEFNDAGIIPPLINPIWNLNPLFSDSSVIGSIFSTLFGYHGNPSLTEAVGYSMYAIITLFIFMRSRSFQPAPLIPHGSATSPSPADTGISRVDPAVPPAVQNSQKVNRAPHT
jgi:high-affinity iron transporter